MNTLPLLETHVRREGNAPLGVPLCATDNFYRSFVTPLAGWQAFFLRELRAALLNRFIHVLVAASTLAGIAPLFGENPGRSAPYFLIQAILFIIPVFALLIGTGAAQADQSERGFLLSQPVSRLTMALGKWSALWVLLVFASGLLVLPSALGEADGSPLIFLWLSAAGAAGVFLALGLAAGYSFEDSVKAHLGALCLWLLLFAGFDLLALAAARAGVLENQASIWVTALMFNPLDALRIGVLFSIDKVPFDTTHAPLLVQDWVAHPGAWLAILCFIWTGSALAWSTFRLGRMEP